LEPTFAVKVEEEEKPPNVTLRRATFIKVLPLLDTQQEEDRRYSKRSSCWKNNEKWMTFHCLVMGSVIGVMVGLMIVLAKK
jgi:hypothetical protein